MSITDLSVSGTTITYTKGDGSTGTITTQDKNTDTNVKQTVTTSNANYPLLLAPSGQTATKTTIKPSYQMLQKLTPNRTLMTTLSSGIKNLQKKFSRFL